MLELLLEDLLVFFSGTFRLDCLLMLFFSEGSEAPPCSDFNEDLDFFAELDLDLDFFSDSDFLEEDLLEAFLDDFSEL